MQESDRCGHGSRFARGALPLSDYSQPALNLNEASYNEFLSEVRAEHVAEVQIKDRTHVGTLKPDQSNAKAACGRALHFHQPTPGIPDVELVKELEAQHVKYSGSSVSGSGSLSTLLIWVLPLLLLGAIYTGGMRRLGQSAALTFGKNRERSTISPNVSTLALTMLLASMRPRRSL